MPWIHHRTKCEQIDEALSRIKSDCLASSNPLANEGPTELQLQAGNSTAYTCNLFDERRD